MNQADGVLERSRETPGWHPGWVKSEFSRILVITQSLSIETFGMSHSPPSAHTHPSLRFLAAVPWDKRLAPFASDKSALEIRRPLSGAQVHPPQNLLQYFSLPSHRPVQVSHLGSAGARMYISLRKSVIITRGRLPKIQYVLSCCPLRAGSVPSWWHFSLPL